MNALHRPPASDAPRRRLRHRSRIGDRGVVSVEMAGFVIPTMVLVMVILYSAFNLVMASIDVTSAAASAARAASMQRTAPAAVTAAQNAAADDLAAHTVTCANLTVLTDTSQWQPGGTVTVTVSCVVQLRNLSAITFLPGTLTTHASATAPLDTHRSISLGVPLPPTNWSVR